MFCARNAVIKPCKGTEHSEDAVGTLVHVVTFVDADLAVAEIRTEPLEVTGIERIRVAVDDRAYLVLSSPAFFEREHARPFSRLVAFREQHKLPQRAIRQPASSPRRSSISGAPFSHARSGATQPHDLSRMTAACAVHIAASRLSCRWDVGAAICIHRT